MTGEVKVDFDTEFGRFLGLQWVSCYNGDNDRAARVLFVQHPREQGEWLRQNPRYARVLTASFALLPRVLDEQHPRSPCHYPLSNTGIQGVSSPGVRSSFASLFTPSNRRVSDLLAEYAFSDNITNEKNAMGMQESVA